jgi:hypothetical protein
MITQDTERKFEHHFATHGIKTKVISLGVDIRKDIESFAQPFACEKLEQYGNLEITLQAIANLGDIPHWVLDSKRHPVSRRGKPMGVVRRLRLNYSLFQDQHRLVADFHQHGLILIDGPAGTAHGYLVQPNSMDPQLRVAFLRMCVFELLRWKGLFVIHGVALARQGKGVLITGAPGRGKTTAGLSLLRAGYRFLSDDFPLLRANGQQVDLLAFQDWLDVREKSVEFFPELQTIALAPRYQGAGKVSFSVSDLYPEATVQSCKASIILFPQVVARQQSYLEAMPKYQVLKELLPQGLQVHSQELAKREFHLYTRLTEHTSGYRLYFGENLWDLPRLLDPLLER